MSKKKNSLSFKISFCGIITALAVVFMFGSLIPSFTYLLPAVSGVLIWTISCQINSKWALLSYVAASALSFMVIPEIEADIFFVLFFGYYPTLRNLIQRINKPLLKGAVKFAIFNIAIIIAFNIVSFIIGFDKMLEGMEGFGDFGVFVLWAMADGAFILYDFSLSAASYFYDKKLKPRFARLMK